MTNRKNRGKDKMVKKMTNAGDLHARDRWFTAAKVLLVLAPFLSLGFLRQASVGGGQDMQQLLSADPSMTVSFMASMTGPFIAYLLGFVQKRLYEGDAGYALMNLTLMTIAEAMLTNMFYFVMMAVLTYFVCGMTRMNPLQAFRPRERENFWGDISGSLVLLVFCAFCLFVSLRLGTI